MFTTTTNGGCFINLTYVITDATGRTIPGGAYPTVTNQLGTNAPAPPPATTLTATPGAIAKANCVPSNTFQFILTGGTPPFSVVTSSTTSSTSVVINPQTGITAGQAVTVSGITSPAATTITAYDSATPRQSTTVTIDCSGAPPPPTPPALVIAPNNFNYTQTTCVNQTSNFVVTGGTPPYSVFFASPRPGASISPSTLGASGQGFSVTGLTNGVLTTNITVADSSTPQLQGVATITCPISSPPTGALTVTPGFDYSLDDVHQPDVELRDHGRHAAVLRGVPDAAERRRDDHPDDGDHDGRRLRGDRSAKYDQFARIPASL